MVGETREVSAGRSGPDAAFASRRTGTGDQTRVELYIDEGDREFNRRVRAALLEEREAIEGEIGHARIKAARYGCFQECRVGSIPTRVGLRQGEAWAAGFRAGAPSYSEPASLAWR
jgi:hypothetical protein